MPVIGFKVSDSFLETHRSQVVHFQYEIAARLKDKGARVRIDPVPLPEDGEEAQITVSYRANHLSRARVIEPMKAQLQSELNCLIGAAGEYAV